MTEISNGNRKTLLLSLSNTVVEDSVTFINPSYQYASSVDLNNDSYFEHVYFAKGEGVLILDHQLDSLTYFQDTTITGIARASGDFNNNGNFDIIYNFNCLGSKGIKISTFSGINIAKLPIVGSVLKSDIWVADVNDDGHIEMEFTSDDGTNEFYSLLDFPLAGSRIACQGELANYRNTGCYNHAPYLPGDSASIVYWYNTISVYDTVTLPANDTIVITAGTRVLFGESAQLVIQGTLIVKGSYYHPVIFEADVSGADNNYWEGICFKNNSASSLRYCIVKDASFGIYYEDNSTSHIIEHSEMTNCEVGIGAFQARTVIKNCYIHENDIGIGCYSSASPVLADNYFPYTHYNNLINNNEVCIGLNLSRVKINKGYNDIYNDSATGYYMQFLAEQRPILIMSTYNYWGSTDTSAIQQRLSPASWFDITPICDSANTLKSSEIIEEIFKNACMAFDNKQYEQAIPLFKQLIDYYPLSSQAYDAVSGMYNTFVESSTNRDEIINYFDLKDADTSINKSLYHIINTNLNFIRRDLGNYEEAFNDYYNKLQSNPTYCDSIYALINLGNILAEAGLYKSSTYPAIQVSAELHQHTIKTKELLLSLLFEDKPSDIELIHPSEEKLLPNGQNQIVNCYPNPFHDYLTIEINIVETSVVKIQIMDNIGALVSDFPAKKYVKGLHVIDLKYFYSSKDENLKSGIYYLKVIVDGESTVTKVIKH